MRTTIDLPDALWAKAKKLAQRRGTTLRQLTIEGLHTVVTGVGGTKDFRLRDASYGKGGLVSGLGETDWDKIRGRAGY